MYRIQLDKDVHPVSEFRANTTGLLREVNTTGRPILLTQHGKGSAVVMSVNEYEKIQEELETFRDIRTAQEEIAAGKGVSHEDAGSHLLSRFQK